MVFVETEPFARVHCGMPQWSLLAWGPCGRVARSLAALSEHARSQDRDGIDEKHVTHNGLRCSRPSANLWALRRDLRWGRARSLYQAT